MYICRFAGLSTYITLDDLKAFTYIKAFIDDEAKDGCCTKLSESREYAEEKLRSVSAALKNREE